MTEAIDRSYPAHSGPRSMTAVSTAPSWWSKYPRRTGDAVRSHERLARWRDMALVLIGAPIWLPLTALIALMIKLQDPTAPTLFRQARTGRDGRRFAVLKFRTMVKDAESMKQDLAHLNELEWPDFKISNDPRITRIGKLLRASSLDELPQLFNVIRGEMGLVGPRPTSFGLETYETWHMARVDLRPGMTGLWQVAARADLNWTERVRLELAYQQRCCTRLDLEILVRTVGAVFNRSGR